MLKRVAITSIAVLDSLGDDLEQNFQEICKGKIGKKIFEETNIGFPIENNLIEKISNETVIDNVRNVKFWHLAGYATAVKAIDRAKLITKKVSIVLGSCLQGMMTLPYHLDIISRKGRAHPKYLFDINTHSLGPLINFRYGFENGTGVLNSACATGLYALEQAFNQIQLGKVDASLVLCLDFPCDKTNLHFFESLGALSKQGNSWPYHQDRDGFLPGDGTCAMILEPLENALERGVEPLAIIEQIETSSENYSLVAPDIKGTGIKSIMERFDPALIKNIDMVSTHATGTVAGDWIEHDIINEYIDVPIVAYKGFIGHTQAAAGLLETSYAVQSMRENLIPGMPWLKDQDLNKNLSSENSQTEIKSFLKFSIGFNGSLTSAIFSKI